MESLSDKLKSLGVRKGIGNQGQSEFIPSKQSPPEGNHPIESVIDGFELATSYGNTFISEKTFPKDTSQLPFGSLAWSNSSILAQWAKIPALFQNGLSGVAYLDTETSGLAGGTGTFAFLIGIGFNVENGFKLIQIFMRDPGQEPSLLAAITKYLDPFETIITFNGRGFDIPLLNTRHVLNGFSSPLSSLNHIDLLPLARKLWRNRLPNRSLSNLEKEILNVHRSGEEVPGWMIPEIYFEYLRTEDARPLEGIFYHNAMDIRSLALLFNYITGLLLNPLEYPDLTGLDLVALARLYEDNQDWEMAIRLYEMGLDQGLPKDFFLQTLDRFGQLYRRQEKWENAEKIWLRAAEHKHINAHIELAKYFEHQIRDYDQAICWTLIALEQMQLAEKNLFRKDTINDLQKRLERLQRKRVHYDR